LAANQAGSACRHRPATRSDRSPKQPEPAKARLIISSDTPNSEMIRTGIPAAMASRAAVEETVVSARAVRNASCIDPPRPRTLPGGIRPVATRSATSSGYGHSSR
jgi:hypothetical protein